MATKTWFSIEAKQEGNTTSTDIYLFDVIGSWDISARMFINELKNIETDQINLHINSPGGEVFDGIAIQNTLKHHKANITVFIDGLAASIASIIALAGDDIRIADNAYVMIHNPTSWLYGEAKDMLKEAEVLIKISDGLAGDYARKMGISVEDARALMDEETWYLGQEAVDAGFANATFEGTRAAAAFNIKRFSAKAPAAVLERFSKPKNKSQTQDRTEILNMTKKDDGKEQATEEQPDAPTEETQVQEDTPETLADADDVDARITAALKKDRKRQADIRALGKKFGFEAAAEKYADGDHSVEDFRAHILDKSPDDWRKSLAIKNPAKQDSEQDIDDTSEGDAVVAKIKEKRKAAFGG